MKKTFSEHDKRIYLMRRSKKMLRLRERRKPRTYKQRYSFSQTNVNSLGRSVPPTTKTVRVPDCFSTQKNLGGVVEFVSGLKDLRFYQKVFFDMSAVNDIDVCAIVMFLMQLNQLTEYQVKYSGNMPENENVRAIFRESGFLDHMKNIDGSRFAQVSDCNLIVKRVSDTAGSELTGKTIKKSLQRLTGTEQHYAPVQSIIQEMTGNAIEHAYGENQERNWLMCVHYEQDAIVFIVSDGGVGILATLYRKYSQIIDALQFRTHIEVLRRAFNQKYGSSTRQGNRNLGLPRIKRMQDENRIDDLIVITNDVYLNFQEPEQSQLLDKAYDGTLYMWKLRKETIEKWNAQ